MPNNDLAQYISQSLQSGLSEQDIKSRLLAIGWGGEDVDAAFAALNPPMAAAKKKRRGGKIVLIILGIIASLIVIVIAFPYIAGLVVGDIPSPDDSDLLSLSAPVPNSDNSYFDLVRMKDAIYEYKGDPKVVSDILSGSKWDDAVAEDIVSHNEDAYKYFEAAGSKSKFQDPAYLSSLIKAYNGSSLGIIDIQSIARAVKMRALYLLKQGKEKEALDDALVLVRLGSEIQDSRGGQVEYLIGSVVKGFGSDVIRRALPTLKMNGAELSKYSERLNKFNDDKNSAIITLKTEYAYIAEIIDAISGGDRDTVAYLFSGGVADDFFFSYMSASKYYLQPNRTKKMFAEDIRAGIDIIDKPCLEEGKDGAEYNSSLITSYLMPNSIGNILFGYFSGQNSYFVHKIKCTDDVYLRLTESLMAVKAYKKDKGSLPASLESLIPGYLNSVPVDPFNGGPLKYSADKKIIYSVGSDHKDSGGDPKKDSSLVSPDPTVSVDF